MTGDSGEIGDLIRRAAGGDRKALAELFTRHRDWPTALVRLRLDRRLQGRLASGCGSRPGSG